MNTRWLGLLTVGLGLGACSTNHYDLDSRIERRTTSAALRYFETCEELAAELRSSLKEELRVSLLQSQDSWQRGKFADTDDLAAAPEAESADSSADASGGQEGVDFSGTNNQEEGVDEADFFKNDGSYLYVINGRTLQILAMPEKGSLQATSSIELEGYPTQMLVDGDRIAVFSTVYVYQTSADSGLSKAMAGDAAIDGGGYWYPSSTLAKLTVIDVANRAQPTVVKEVYVEGNYQTARKIDSTIRMLAYSWMNIPGVQSWPDLPNSYYDLAYNDPLRDELFTKAVHDTILKNNQIINATPLSSFVPSLFERQGTELVEHPFTTGACQHFAVADDAMARGFTSILTLDILGDGFSFESDHIVSNWSTVYASKDVLLVAESAHSTWWFWGADDFEEATNIHRFDISQGAKTTYTGSGRVRGTILNQFSLSEYKGDIRVASTTGRWARWWMNGGDADSSNHVFVLRGDDSLAVVGQINDIAVGERIWSSRFMGEQAFLVTFVDIDPLFTIDLADPENPSLKGELKVNGVSTYIHPIDGNAKLLTIGYGGDENGLNWATQISTFDVADFDNPSLIQAMSLAPPTNEGWSWAYSEATWEHKAFQYWPASRLLAIPLSTYRYTNNYNSYEYLSRLELLQVAEDGTLSTYGSIDHSSFFNDNSDYWWSFRDVRRSTFVVDGDVTYIYAVSDKGITSHRLDTLSMQASVELPGTQYHYYDY